MDRNPHPNSRRSLADHSSADTPESQRARQASRAFVARAEAGEAVDTTAYARAYGAVRQAEVAVGAEAPSDAQLAGAAYAIARIVGCDDSEAGLCTIEDQIAFRFDGCECLTMARVAARELQRHPEDH